MGNDDIVALVVAFCSLVSLVLSLWNMTKGLPFADRFFPAILQGIIFVSSLITRVGHGHPTESFAPMFLIFLWAIFAIGSSIRLYRIRVRTFRVLGLSQFMQAVAMIPLAALGYVQECYFYYGRVVWDP
jgi:hypothetical protein